MSIAKSVYKFYSKVFFGNRCELCGEVIEFDQTLCHNCKNPPKITSPLCKHCGYSKEDCVCKQHKNEYKQIVAPFYYKDCIAKAIHNFKKCDMPFLSKKFSNKMFTVVEENYSDINFDLITYVPFRKMHQKMRGYNQSQLLAENLSKKMNVPCQEVLVKIRNTGVQHKKTAKQRKADIFGAFDVKNKYKNTLDGKVILLVDDVKTTGATLNECAKMLKIYSAKAVYCATFAITKKEQ